MGRKSALTPEQWIEIERRHLVGGESIRALAKEFGVDEAAVRRRINPHKSAPEKAGKSLRALAEKQIQAESTIRDISAHISALPVARQQTFNDLKGGLTSISNHLVSAAEYGAMTSHRLSGIAHNKVAEIDDAAPLDDDSLKALKGIAVLTQMSNASAEIGINLLRANKDMVEGMNKPEHDSAQLLRDIAAQLPD
jgi:transposase-like protein